VLVVEPDPHTRAAAVALLRAEGYQVLTAASLDEALLHAAQNLHVDLLVTEEQIASEESGEQLIRSLRATLGDQLKSVLLVDSTLKRGTRQFDPRVRVVLKPVSADELLQALVQLRKP
jgi:CheY-like chemotaxis protein